jgi:alanyl-tRNA synthetase
MKLARFQIDSLVEQVREINGVKVAAAQVDNLDVKGLRNFADLLKGKLQSGIVVLGTVNNGRVSLITVVTKDITNTYHAGHIIKEVATIVGGSGGGRPDMAQAGGKNPEKLSEALDHVFQIVQRCTT